MNALVPPEELDGLLSSAFVAKSFTGAKVVKGFNHLVAAIVFGSFLSAKEKLGDLDVAVYLEMKQQTDEEYSPRMDKLLEQAWREGRTPSNLVEASCWPRLEILRILRRGLRQLRLHEISGLQRLHALECCVVFGSPDAVKAILPNARIKVLHISEN
jgi:predicted nucleotidyltransferase